jgi:beta-glucosidase
LRDHIAAAGRALAEGVDLRGYLVWSLLDNLEWAEGFARRFGLVRCDRATLNRTIKASGHWYARLIASNGSEIPVAFSTPRQS